MIAQRTIHNAQRTVAVMLMAFLFTGITLAHPQDGPQPTPPTQFQIRTSIGSGFPSIVCSPQNNDRAFYVNNGQTEYFCSNNSGTYQWQMLSSGAAFYQTVQANGSSKPQEAKLNLISGANSTVSCADNPGATSTDCTVSSTGGGSVNVNGSSVSSPNFNSSLPAPSAALYAPTPYQVSGSNVIATYPGNPPNTTYVFTGNSINGDDHQVLGPLITVTTWTANGTTCSFNNSGTNGLVAGEWIATNNVTGWPSPPYGPGVGYANGYTNFQISSSGLTSSTFTFACPLISATSGSGGNVEPSGAWLPYQTDSLLPSGEQGTVILRTAAAETIVSTATNYSSLYHSLSPAVTGNPAYLIVNNALNDYISCSSAATTEAAYTSLFEQAHTDGWYVVVGSTTPDALATNGCFTINAIMVATENWLYAQGPTQSNLATGAYWDYFVDVRGVLTNARDSSLMQQSNFTLAPGGAIMMAQMFAQVLHTHQSIFLNKRGDIWAGLPNANSSFTSDNGFAHFLPNVGSGHAESWWDAAYANEYMGFNTTNARVEFPIGVGFGSADQFTINASGQPGFASGCSGQYLKADNTGCGTPSVVPVPTVVDTSTPVTVSTTNVSEFHFNQNATAATAVTYDLPTAAAGKQFCFSNSYNGSAANTGTLELLTSASGQFIIYTDGTLSATGGFVISTGAAADAACVVGVDSTHWMLYTTRGTWAKY